MGEFGSPQDPAVPVRQLLREIREPGYWGSSNFLVRNVNQGRPAGTQPHLPARQDTRLLDTRPDRVTGGQAETLAGGRRSRPGAERRAAERELHARLVRIALAEVQRRAASTPVAGRELDDVAHQAADDAMLAILAKLADFRGESRFITWAYRFVILEVSAKLGRHYWRHPLVALDAGQWERLPDRFGIDPVRRAEFAGVLAEVRRVVEEELTAHQRRIFVAVVVGQIPRNALAAGLGLQKNAVYKVIFGARRKIRRALVAKGYLEEPGRSGDE